MDAFDDVNFTVVGPARTGHPECRPDTCQQSALIYAGWTIFLTTDAPRHVLQIKDHQSMGVLLPARETHSVSSTAGSNVRGVCSDSNDAIRDAGQIVTLSGASINEVDVSTSRIVLLNRRSVSIQNYP